MNQWLTVMRFEYMTFVKSKSFIAMTIIMLLAGLILPAIPTFSRLLDGGLGFDSGDGTGNHAAIVDASGHFTADICAEYLSAYTMDYYDDAEQACAAVSNGICQFAVVIANDDFTLYVPSMKISFYDVQDQVDTMVRMEYRLAQLREAGISGEKAMAILNYSPTGQIVAVAAPDGDNAGNYQENIIYTYAMNFILYFGLLMYGQYILTSVVREKTTKTMELLITSCKSDRLINGKVLGVGLAGLTQLTLVVAAALLSMYMNSQGQVGAEAEMFVVAVKPGIIVCMVVFFLLGFFAFAYVYAALASTVSRMEDANSAAMVPMYLIIAGFLASMMGMLTPDALWVTVLSYVPFLTPMVMFMRVCMGAAAVWEVWLSIGLQGATILLAGWLGARIYRAGTLMYGKKATLKDIAGLLR